MSGVRVVESSTTCCMSSTGGSTNFEPRLLMMKDETQKETRSGRSERTKSIRWSSLHTLLHSPGNAATPSQHSHTPRQRADGHHGNRQTDTMATGRQTPWQQADRHHGNAATPSQHSHTPRQRADGHYGNRQTDTMATGRQTPWQQADRHHGNGQMDTMAIGRQTPRQRSDAVTTQGSQTPRQCSGFVCLPVVGVSVYYYTLRSIRCTIFTK